MAPQLRFFSQFDIEMTEISPVEAATSVQIIEFLKL
jgi:hypothetical protein